MNNRRPFLAGLGIGFFISSLFVGALILTGRLDLEPFAYFGALFMSLAVLAHSASK